MVMGIKKPEGYEMVMHWDGKDISFSCDREKQSKKSSRFEEKYISNWDNLYLFEQMFGKKKIDIYGVFIEYENKYKIYGIDCNGRKVKYYDSFVSVAYHLGLEMAKGVMMDKEKDGVIVYE